jgi:hypothetical protein
MRALTDGSNLITAARSAATRAALARENKFQVTLPDGVTAGEQMTVDIPSELPGGGQSITFPVPENASPGETITVTVPDTGRGGALDASHVAKNAVHQQLQVDAATAGEEQLAAYRALFDSLDADGGGSLDVAELRQAFAVMDVVLSDAEFAAVLAEADADGNGELDFEEFQTVLDSRVKHDNAGQGSYAGEGGHWSALVKQAETLSPGLDLARLGQLMHSKVGTLFKQPRVGNVLTKVVQHKSAWKERFFVLGGQEGTVQYFKDEADAMPLGRIQLTADCMAVRTDIAPHSFSIVTPGGATELRVRRAKTGS